MLMQDPEALRWLHRQAWKEWSMELLGKVASAACAQPVAAAQPFVPERRPAVREGRQRTSPVNVVLAQHLSKRKSGAEEAES